MSVQVVILEVPTPDRRGSSTRRHLVYSSKSEACSRYWSELLVLAVHDEEPRLADCSYDYVDPMVVCMCRCLLTPFLLGL